MWEYVLNTVHVSVGLWQRNNNFFFHKLEKLPCYISSFTNLMLVVPEQVALLEEITGKPSPPTGAW